MATQYSDLDGDGYGDNPDGNNADAFITDATQWEDADNDGYGDNQNGRNPDLFPDNPTQYADADGDGLGDNQSEQMPIHLCLMVIMMAILTMSTYCQHSKPR